GRLRGARARAACDRCLLARRDPARAAPQAVSVAGPGDHHALVAPRRRDRGAGGPLIRRRRRPRLVDARLARRAAGHARGARGGLRPPRRARRAARAAARREGGRGAARTGDGASRGPHRRGRGTQAPAAELGPHAAAAPVRARRARGRATRPRRARRRRGGPRGSARGRRRRARRGGGRRRGRRRSAVVIDALTTATYRGAMAVASALLDVALRVRAVPAAWRAIGDRLGRLDAAGRATASAGTAIWLHAASVGELVAARPLLARLRERFPERVYVVSTLTRTGRALAQDLPEVHLPLLFPLDAPAVVRRLLAQFRLEAFLFTETEIWPTFLAEL